MQNRRQQTEDGFLLSNEIRLLKGRTGPSGAEYALFKQRGTEAWVATADFAPDPGPGLRALSAKGIKAFSSKQKQSIIDQLERQTDYPRAMVAERVGLTDFGFCYPHGRILGPQKSGIPIAYPTSVVCVRSSGTLEEWKENVAQRLRGHHLPIFCMMLAFAAATLSLTRIQGNYLVMLSGPPRKGKTTCIDVMASICGPALDSPDGRYYMKFNNTLNRLEELLPHYADLPVIIDELSSHGSKTSRVSDFRTLVHHLAGVDVRGRHGDALVPAKQTRTIITMTSNDASRELLIDETPDAAAAVEDRLIDIPVPGGEEGAFNGLAPDREIAREFAESLRENVERYYGTAMPSFLTNLVKRRRANEDSLIAGLNRRRNEFRRLGEVQALGPVSSRILDIVALAVAAGELAQHLDVLPRTLDCRAAALHCLRLHLGFRAEADPVQRLLSWVRGIELIDLRGGKPSLSDDALETNRAFINLCAGVTQICVDPKLFRQAFPKYRLFLKELVRAKTLKMEGLGKHRKYTTYTPVRPNGRGKRMYVFSPDVLVSWLEENGYSPIKAAPKRRER